MNTTPRHTTSRGRMGGLLATIAMGLLATGCLGEEPEGLAEAPAAEVTVKMDFFHKPLPEIPLPNDIATRHDPDSPTSRRINASLIAPTAMERHVREQIDTLDGWGLYQPISVPFTGPLDVQSILDAHRDANYDLSDDVIYLFNVDPDSPKYGQAIPLDVGNGNHPVVLERMDYWKNDPRGDTNSLYFEETDEDVNGNGQLDPGEDANRNGQLDPGEDLDNDGELDLPEDTDADGILDKPNYLPGANPAKDDLAGRADALMSFYERETHTLLARPMEPLDERTTYAVVITRRLKDEGGAPVGSPFKFVNHVAQTEALKPLKQILPSYGMGVDDVAFAFSYTTQTVQSNWIAVYEGLHGQGVQKHIGEQFPPRIGGFEPIKDPAVFNSNPNVHILYTEEIIDALALLATQLLGQDAGSRQFDILLEAQQYVDYHVIGYYESPQLFPREDEEGNPVPLGQQAWPQDLTAKPAPVRSERIYFWLTVPRKEISPRGQGEQAPVVFLGHGYTGNRLDALLLGGYIARHGVAVLSIENVSHGLELAPDDRQLAELLLGNLGLTPFLDAASKSRAFDQNNDGVVDSGADFWTAYMFHTRDVVRQSALDYMQMVRVLKSFDGQRRWDFDLNQDGQPELAGDFDGDGVLDVGALSPLTATGASLGGFMSSMLGALEPDIDAIAPIAGGGGISDLGVRSVQGGVREAFILRALGPLYVGTLDADSGQFLIETIVNDLNDDSTFPVAQVAGVTPGDTILAVNLDSEERFCGYVSKEGTMRVPIATDRGARHEVRLYKGNALVTGSTECEIEPGLEPMTVIDAFEFEIEHQGEIVTPGAPLVALAEGLGLRRANPELRRFGPIAQLILDPADPAVYARHLTREPLVYPNLGTSTWTNTLIVTTLGDMNVPAHGGVTMGRAAGYIDYLNDDPRYGKPANQVLIDTHTAEAVHTLKRYTDDEGNGVHLDVENFAGGRDIWGDSIPRLDPPLRLIDYYEGDSPEESGYSGAIFPFPIPTGQHGFPFPGELPDRATRICQDNCPEGESCGCRNVETFDVGTFMFNMIGEFLKSGGKQVSARPCHSSDTCPDTVGEPPEMRPELR